MCINPIRIKNPNKGLNTRRTHIVDGKEEPLYNFLKDCTSDYINVPCGHCPECVAIRQMSLVQRVQFESHFNYLFFNTLTYNQEMIPCHVCESTGWFIPYADMHDFVCMVKRVRKEWKLYSSRSLRYFVVSELGEKRGRPHFHVLWFVEKYDKDDIYTPLQLEKVLHGVVLKNWSRNVATKVNAHGQIVPDNFHPVYKPLCTYVVRHHLFGSKSTFDLHWVQPTVDDSSSNVAFYVSKYMIKPSDRTVRLQRALALNYDPYEYDRIWQKVKPRWTSSRGFGLNGHLDDEHKLIIPQLSIDLARSMVERSKSYDAPRFLTDDGKVFPLSRYYSNNLDIYDNESRVFFYDKSLPKRSGDGGILYTSREKDFSEETVVREKHASRLDLIESHDKSSLFTNL